MNLGFRIVFVILLVSVCLPAIAASKHLFIAGSAFNARTSSQTVSYTGGGCINSYEYVTTDLQLPAGATINGFRLYYYSDTVGGVIGYLTRYNGAGGSIDQLEVYSTVADIYDSDYLGMTQPEVFDSERYSYTLNAKTFYSTDKFCGIRVFYEAS